MTGKLITFEGSEGVGKSTQAAMLYRALMNRGISAHLTREPGGSLGAEKIRRIIMDESWDPTTEVLLHLAARADHVSRTIIPRLEKGQWVISDRFADSTTAYQGCGHGVPIPAIASMARIAFGTLEPDLTFILDFDVEDGLRRAKSRRVTNKYDRMDLDFHRRVRACYLELAKLYPERCILLDVSDKTAGQIHREVITWTHYLTSNAKCS